MLELVSENFNPFARLETFHQHVQAEGGVCHFIGIMRANDLEGKVLQAMNLEYYAQMCKKMLHKFLTQAQQRFALDAVLLVHRVGMIYPLQPILLVATVAKHRGQAFDACQFITDWLKSEAPFWKEEIYIDGNKNWVVARASDNVKKAQWS